MSQRDRYVPVKDERDQFIQTNSRSYALEWATAATQIVTVLCAIKGNPAWKGTLSILFFSIAFSMFYHFKEYEEKPYKQVGVISFCIGLVLLFWFGIMD